MDEPFTNSLTTDILLFSSFLSSQATVENRVPQDKVKADHVMLNYISTILNIGIIPNGGNALLGHIGTRLIKCVVFTETSAGMQNVLKSSPSFQRPKTCSIQLVSSSSKRGAELLNNWVQDEGASSFDAHLQDVFDIINHLQSHHQVADLEKFLLWTHRRAFRKLGSWVKEFSERWGNTSPFVIMEDCLDAILECSPRWTHCFDISLESIEYEVVKVFVDEDQLTNMEPGRYKYRVDSSNIQKWIALFKYLLEHLEMALLHSAAKPHVAIAQRKLPSTPPNEISTQIVTLRVACLHALRRVFRHLFSLPVPKFHQALAEAENKTTSALMPTQSLQTFAPSLGRNTEFGLEESPASRAFGTLLMMTAWYTSSISIWYHAARFLQDKTIQVERFSTEETGSFECHEEDAAAILQVITSRKPDCEAISALQRAARAATIHAEAALMGYAFYDQSKEISSALQLPVGVSHKCCHLCWLLKKELNDHPTAKDLLLPGTHSQFLPWIPPFGVSDCTLQSLRIKLLVIIRSRLRQERALSGMVGYTGISPFT